jgi:hypothetical protein
VADFAVASACDKHLHPDSIPLVSHHPPPPSCNLLVADKLLASKKNRELLESYEERQAAAVAYMELVNPRASVMAGPLTDPSVRTCMRT